jgi:hypothetical protein
MKKIILLILTIGILSSCSNNDDNFNNDANIGVWKLIEGRINFSPSPEPPIDYSNENIVYNFQANGILLVSGGDNIGMPNGVYEYVLGEDYLGGQEKIPIVEIEGFKWVYTMENEQMTLTTNYMDGTTLLFEKELK